MSKTPSDSDNTIKVSFPLTKKDGNVNLGNFNNGAALMEHLAKVAAQNDLPDNTEIRITVQAVRARGRHAKWKTM